MLVGILLKNYKIYGGVKYIPVTTNHNFIAYIGDNGVGKSSILEALDTYFNGREWNVTKGASTTDANIPYITIAHLIDKNIANNIIGSNNELLKKIEKINECMWDFDTIENRLGSKSFEAKDMMLDLRKLNGIYKETHYLILSGRGYWSTTHAHFGSFDGIIANLFDIQEFDSQKEDSNEKLRKGLVDINDFIRKYYSYIYMPVEAGIEEFTKLETNNMQKLIGTDINEKIREIIADKTLDNINIKLNAFISELESKLKFYTYKHSKRTNISMNELTQKVIELFFSIRTLHKIKDNKKISADQLSSGEKRQAFIEVSAGLLSSQDIRNKEIIFAVDEPEASLSVSNNFSQFEKIINLQKNNMQILITTHWYGFLPVTLSGNAHFLSKEVDGDKIKFNFSTFNLYNYRERLRQIVKNRKDKDVEMPNDIQLKSMHDLVQSIVSSVRLNKPYNWLICEGSSDKVYFDFYFKDLVKDNNLRILPVGGASEVIKIYEYLKLPMSEKDNIKGKIYCLIDSDGKSEQLVCDSKCKNNMVAKRILNNSKDQRTFLVDISSNNYEMKTEIEDCLYGAIFIETLKTYIEDKNIVTILEDEKNFKDKSLNSHFCFNLRDADWKILKGFFDQDSGYRKIEFAKRYVEIARDNSIKSLDWIDEIKRWFKNKN
ncbi:AAA family ATPase [uncultured Campylobacter sp.]|uniref:AAA family ATPase n=1 Tax=uncultured Campylobacter sp. TaxID=218934 RepID=UPI00262A8C7C|nr:AAA family ATPase [uncultured Campylobacter sp.]